MKNGYVQLKRPDCELGRKNKSLNNLLEAHEQTSPLNLTKSAMSQYGFCSVWLQFFLKKPL